MALLRRGLLGRGGLRGGLGSGLSGGRGLLRRLGLGRRVGLLLRHGGDAAAHRGVDEVRAFQQPIERQFFAEVLAEVVHRAFALEPAADGFDRLAALDGEGLDLALDVAVVDRDGLGLDDAVDQDGGLGREHGADAQVVDLGLAEGDGVRRLAREPGLLELELLHKHAERLLDHRRRHIERVRGDEGLEQVRTCLVARSVGATLCELGLEGEPHPGRATFVAELGGDVVRQRGDDLGLQPEDLRHDLERFAGDGLRAGFRAEGNFAFLRLADLGADEQGLDASVVGVAGQTDGRASLLGDDFLAGLDRQFDHGEVAVYGRAVGDLGETGRTLELAVDGGVDFADRDFARGVVDVEARDLRERHVRADVDRNREREIRVAVDLSGLLQLRLADGLQTVRAEGRLVAVVDQVLGDVGAHLRQVPSFKDPTRGVPRPETGDSGLPF